MFKRKNAGGYCRSPVFKTRVVNAEGQGFVFTKRPKP